MKVLIKREVGEVREARRIKKEETESREDKRKREAGWWPGEECQQEEGRGHAGGKQSLSASKELATQRNGAADPPGPTGGLWFLVLGGRGKRGRAGWGTDRQSAVSK